MSLGQPTSVLVYRATMKVSVPLRGLMSLRRASEDPSFDVSAFKFESPAGIVTHHQGLVQ